MNIYIAGPMRGIAQFNFPAFHQAAKQLRAQGHSVFNPAERDLNKHGDEIADSPTGDLKDIAYLGFSLRDALADDTHYICKEADAVVLLPGWEKSSGARAEKALGEALGHQIMFL